MTQGNARLTPLSPHCLPNHVNRKSGALELGVAAGVSLVPWVPRAPGKQTPGRAGDRPGQVTGCLAPSVLHFSPDRMLADCGLTDKKGNFKKTTITQ